MRASESNGSRRRHVSHRQGARAPLFLPRPRCCWPGRPRTRKAGRSAPVKLILPLGPGSGVDITARLVGERLSAKWGQSVVIENRPGGDGVVAITAFISGQRRSLAADVADLLVHASSVDPRQDAVRRQGIRAGRAHDQHHRGRGGALVHAVQDDGRSGRLREGQSRQAQLGDHHRLLRFRVRRLPEEGRPADRQGALPQHGAGGDRSRRGPHPAHDVGLRDPAAACAIRKAQAARGHRVAARVDAEGCADHGRGRLPRHSPSTAWSASSVCATCRPPCASASPPT